MQCHYYSLYTHFLPFFSSSSSCYCALLHNNGNGSWLPSSFSIPTAINPNNSHFLYRIKIANRINGFILKDPILSRRPSASLRILLFILSLCFFLLFFVCSEEGRPLCTTSHHRELRSGKSFSTCSQLYWSIHSSIVPLSRGYTRRAVVPLTDL